MDANQLTDYEKTQNFNPVVNFLHNVRYRHLIKLFQDYSKTSLNQPIKVLEIGCAHAKTFSLLNNKFKIDYLGIELDKGFVDIAQNRYGAQSNFKIVHGSIADHFSALENVDIILALETLEHIPEKLVVRVVEQIAQAKPKIFICSVPNEVGPIVWLKNIGSLVMGYMRHKEYKWRETFYAGIFNLDKIETHGVGHRGFDWRWLAQTIRHNLKINKIYSTPFAWLPKTFSFSVIFICFANGKTEKS
jgi:hypothetical protein